ncbi:MAG: peptidylprolyl isomerase [Alphaproteobacteria bacterium]|nr:peptidylprolyl isomerase [Alphaproteobacteria bacterium]
MTRLRAVALSLFAIGLLAGSPAMAQSGAPKGKPEAKTAKKPAKRIVVAKVEGTPVYQDEVIAAFRRLPPNVRRQGIDSLYERVLELLIERRMMTIYGRRENYAENAEVKRRMKLAEDQFIREVYLDALIRKYLTEDRVRAHYDEFARQNPERKEIRARHILVETEAKAAEVTKLAKSGQDFAKLASTSSIGPSAKRGGDLGYFTAQEMVKPFSEVAFKLKKGQVSTKPVKTQFGWHVIKVEDIRVRKVPPYSQVKPQMRREVWTKLGQDFIRQYREQAKVERFSYDGKKKLARMPKKSTPAPATKK